MAIPLLIRRAFDKDALRVSEALAKHVPPGVAERLNAHYDPSDSDAYLDLYYPSQIEGGGRALPTVVWVRGGRWISGSKNQVADYAKSLASKGYTVAAVDYSIVPGATHPKQAAKREGVRRDKCAHARAPWNCDLEPGYVNTSGPLASAIAEQDCFGQVLGSVARRSVGGVGRRPFLARVRERRTDARFRRDE